MGQPCMEITIYGEKIVGSQIAYLTMNYRKLSCAFKKFVQYVV